MFTNSAVQFSSLADSSASTDQRDIAHLGMERIVGRTARLTFLISQPRKGPSCIDGHDLEFEIELKEDSKARCLWEPTGDWVLLNVRLFTSFGIHIPFASHPRREPAIIEDFRLSDLTVSMHGDEFHRTERFVGSPSRCPPVQAMFRTLKEQCLLALAVMPVMKASNAATNPPAPRAIDEVQFGRMNSSPSAPWRHGGVGISR
jgi:hypothetical protein